MAQFETIKLDKYSQAFGKLTYLGVTPREIYDDDRKPTGEFNFVVRALTEGKEADPTVKGDKAVLPETIDITCNKEVPVGIKAGDTIDLEFVELRFGMEIKEGFNGGRAFGNLSKRYTASKVLAVK